MSTETTQNGTSRAEGQSRLNAGLDGEKLLFEEWWGEPPTELNVLEQRSNDQALAMWVWQAWQARAKLEPPNVELTGSPASSESV